MSKYLDSEIWVAGKLYDTREVLKINENYKLEVIEIGGKKIGIIDDFYSNPDMVREIALNGNGTRMDNLGYPGYRVSISIGWQHHDKEYIEKRSNLMKEVWPGFNPTYVNWGNITQLCFNLQKEYRTWPNPDKDFRYGNPELQPHSDYDYINAIVYINKDDEWKGKNGTGIYRHKPTGLVSYPLTNPNLIKKLQSKHDKHIKDILWNNKYYEPNEEWEGEWVSESNDVWELEYLIEMKYNRLVFYSGELFHAAYMNKTDFIDIPRIVQVNFCKPEENQINRRIV